MPSNRCCVWYACRSVREDLYLATDGQVTYYSADVNLFIAREESPLLYSSILIPRKVGIGRVYNIFFYVKKLTAQLKSGD